MKGKWVFVNDTTRCFADQLEVVRNVHSFQPPLAVQCAKAANRTIVIGMTTTPKKLANDHAGLQAVLAFSPRIPSVTRY